MYHHRCHTRVKGKPFQTRSTNREKRTTLSILTPQNWLLLRTIPLLCRLILTPSIGGSKPHWSLGFNDLFFSWNLEPRHKIFATQLQTEVCQILQDQRDGWDRAAKKKNHPPGNQHPSSMTYKTIDLIDLLKTDGWKMVFWDLKGTLCACVISLGFIFYFSDMGVPCYHQGPMPFFFPGDRRLLFKA